MGPKSHFLGDFQNWCFKYHVYFHQEFKKIAFKNIICADIKKTFLILLKTHSHIYAGGLYMIGYGIVKNIYKFPPFSQLNQEYLERQNSKKCCIPSN